MKKVIMIEGMSCGHCVMHAKNALEEIAGITGVDVDLQGKKAVVELSQEVDNDVLKNAIEDAGYDVVEIKNI
jgi:copper chaperone